MKSVSVTSTESKNRNTSIYTLKKSAKLFVTPRERQGPSTVHDRPSCFLNTFKTNDSGPTPPPPHPNKNVIKQKHLLIKFFLNLKELKWRGNLVWKGQQSAGLIRLFCQQKKRVFALTELHRTPSCWFALHQWRAEKGWLKMYLTPLPHIPALFMSLMGTTMQDSWSCFFNFQMSVFHNTISKAGWETEWRIAVCIFLLFSVLLIRPVILFQFSFTLIYWNINSQN